MNDDEKFVEMVVRVKTTKRNEELFKEVKEITDKIIDVYGDFEVAVKIQGISDLIATLQQYGVHGENALRMKDVKTGEIFAVSYLGKDES